MNTDPTDHPSTATETTASDAGGLDLQHSRRSVAPRATLKLVLPLVGLLVVPTAGLLYALFSSPGAEDATEPEAASDGGKKSKKKKSKAGKARSDGAAKCCSKLASLGKTAPIDQRAAFLSAAQACEAAPDEASALARARSNLGTAKVDVPGECQ